MLCAIVVKMRFEKKIIAPLMLLIACNFYGDLDLGSNFYYQTEPSFNSIVVPVDTDKPYTAQIKVIQGVDHIGFNNEYIFVSSVRNDSTLFWVINKKEEANKLGYDRSSNIRLSNMKQVDSTEFYVLISREHIELKSKKFYQKQAGWR